MSGGLIETSATRWAALTPAYLAIGIFMVIPVAIMVGISFMAPNVFGGVIAEFTPSAYVQFLFRRDFDDNLVFNAGYLAILGRSVLLAGGATLLCFLIGFPAAYYIARQPARMRNLLVLLVTIPFWTNLLIRAYAWIIILGRDGVIDSGLGLLGLVAPGETASILYTPGAVLIGLTYTYLPLMILPIYSTLERLDFRLMEAAADLYAGRWNSLRLVVLPLAAPGILAGVLLVFAPALGDFISANLLGGSRQLMLGNLIQMQFSTARNWPFGAAVAVILLVFVLLSMALYWRLSKKAA